MPLINAYLSHQRVRGFSERTIDRRRWSLHLWERHLADHDACLSTATVEHLEGFLARWPAPQSRYSIRADIHQLYRFAARRRLMVCPDPTDQLDPPRLPRRRPTPIEVGDVRRLIATVAGTDRLIVMLAAHAGLRCSEVAAVHGDHADLERRWLTVCGKGDRTDIVPLSHTLADELARWPRRGPIVPYLNGATVGNRIRTLLRRHGICGRPHDLRHSFGTEANQHAGGDIIAVKQLMRHTEVATTMRYVKPSPLAHTIVDRLYQEAA